MTRPSPPSGAPPPQTAVVDGDRVVELAPLAEAITVQYQAEYPDEVERYGPAGRAWCVHDNLYLLAWAFSAHRGDVRFDEQVLWLGQVLRSRDFPLDRLARDLRIAADVLRDRHVPHAEPVAAILSEGAGTVVRFAAGPPAP